MGEQKKKSSGFFKKVVKYRTLLLMLLPSALMVFVFSYLPMCGLVMAFERFNYSDGIFGSPWVGLENFKFFFVNHKFHHKINICLFYYNSPLPCCQLF